MSINVSIEVNPLLDSDWFKIGGSHDVDTVIRAAGFDSGDEVAKLVISAEGHEPVTVSVITLGKHHVKGLPGTDIEHEDVSDNKDYIHQHLQALQDSGNIIEGCWLSADVSGMESWSQPHDDFRISDEYVSGSIGQVLKELPWLLKEAGHTAIGEQLDEAYEAHGTSAYDNDDTAEENSVYITIALVTQGAVSEFSKADIEVALSVQDPLAGAFSDVQPELKI